MESFKITETNYGNSTPEQVEIFEGYAADVHVGETVYHLTIRDGELEILAHGRTSNDLTIRPRSGNVVLLSIEERT